ncbi:MAG TPA: peptidoglycan-binding domain-containing protein, partial [Aeromicrobium sp.]|nr:peptidoglycan-binding domain-containing protein [Aeromicrobium sp.]
STGHMHISFGWAGARAKTSFWTGKVAGIDFGPCVRFKGQPAVLTSSARSTPCYTPTPLLKTSKQPTLQYGASNVALKKVQKALSISQTGRFDAATWQAIKAYQGRHDLPVTGAMDQPTWTSLFLDENKSTVVEGYTWLSSARHGLKYYYKGTLSGSRTDKPVLVLQIALKMPRKDRNGYFGKLTKAVVIAMQKEAGLKQTGKVSKAEWEALVKLRS